MLFRSKVLQLSEVPEITARMSRTKSSTIVVDSDMLESLGFIGKSSLNVWMSLEVISHVLVFL